MIVSSVNILFLLLILFFQCWLQVLAPDVATTATTNSEDESSPDPDLALEGQCVVVCDAMTLPSTAPQTTDDRWRKKPKRYAFSVMKKGTDAPTRDEIVFDHHLLNVGNAFDLSRSVFTAAVSGVYFFQFTIFKVSNNRELTVSLTVNENPMMYGFANSATTRHDTAHNSGVLSLYEGDKVQLRIDRGDLRGGWQYSTFSGYLLYEEDGF